jgi:hypothetical protein
MDCTWQHDAHGNSRWIALGLTKSRWWIGTAMTAIAAVLALMSYVAAIALVLMALACFALALGWDFFRWHWPFLPIEIQNQITYGLALLRQPNFEVADLTNWQIRTRDVIANIWNPQAQQLKAFEAVGGTPVRKVPGYHKKLLIDQIRVLKELDPTWP